MHILVIGSGGREHALVWQLARAGHRITAAPGNPGIEELAECVAIAASDHAGLVELGVTRQVDLVVVGPEAPLVAGLADKLRAAGLLAFGPGADGARLEGSKVFSKQFFARHRIPTAPFVVATTVADADAAIDRLTSGSGVVVKADGLAAGKGVVVARDAQEAKAAAREMLEARRFGAAGQTVVIEQRIVGREASLLALTDGARLEVLPAVEDHKAIFDGDLGPNTGGMGAVSPAWVTDAILSRIRSEILEPSLRGLRAEGIDYRGVLYAGVMVEPAGAPYLLEYNCRFGDPETQPIMARMRGDLGGVLHGAARGEMPVGALAWDARVAVCVVVAAAGYPDAARTGDPIGGVLGDEHDAIVFHAGTARRPGDGQLVSAGGRVLGVTALGLSVEQARAKAYAVVDRIELAGKQVRGDIGARQVVP
ncbi:MAG TPA: phosphoribosylamine--glycine ligase [Kofleriaceae bacterium]|jgi:phosphoribosylamine--glycine ligase|nr:phosphoribosylamine--glycine ligase [Kofleriaceae bacterium]